MVKPDNTYILPASWASGLINGDFSAFDLSDLEALNQFAQKTLVPGEQIVSCSEEVIITTVHDASVRPYLTECLEYQTLKD